MKFESRSPGLGVRSGGARIIQSIVSHIRGGISQNIRQIFDIPESSDMVLTLFSELDCRGQAAVVKDKEVNLTKAGVNFKVKVQSNHLLGSNISIKNVLKSAIVEGNPWILFSTERFQEFLCFLEDGRYFYC